MKITAYTMHYKGDKVNSDLILRNYISSDYSVYKRIYEECFFEMRTALELVPVNCCDSSEELLAKSSDIFVLEKNGRIIGSVAIYKNEIDDLIVAKKFQRKGYGKKLLDFAVASMQESGISPITLHVADWNKSAVKLYLDNGFVITGTEIFGED